MEKDNEIQLIEKYMGWIDEKDLDIYELDLILEELEMSLKQLELEEMDEGVAKSVAKGAGMLAAQIVFIGGGIPLTVALFAAYKAIKAMASKAERKCGMLRITNQRDVCLAKATAMIAEKRLKIIKKSEKNCKNDKCKKKVAKRISKLGGKIKKANEKLKKLKGKYTEKGKMDKFEAGKKQATDKTNVRL
jgi:hypothetical protein